MLRIRQADIETRAFWGLAFLVFVTSVIVLYLPFLLGLKHFFHDNLTAATVIGLFYDRLGSGDSWLWSAALNGGHPLWPSAEIFPIFDPVVVLVYALAVPLGTDWMTPYHVSTTVWLFVFAIGGGLCAYRLNANRWTALLAFVLLFCGPIVLSIPAHSSGYLVPFRYFPLTLYFYLCLRDKITFKHTAYFAIILAFSLDGYQTIFPVLACLALFLAELLVGGRSYLVWLRRLCAPRRLWLFLIPVFTGAPTVAWLAYTENLVALPREYGDWTSYIYSLPEFFRYLFFVYHDIFEFKDLPPVDHIASSVGFLATPFLLFGLRQCVLDSLSARRQLKAGGALPPFTAAFPLWLAFTVALACGVLGLRELIISEGSVFGVRNLAFLISLVYFLLVLAAARGFAEMINGHYSLPDAIIDTLIFTFFGILLLCCMKSEVVYTEKLDVVPGILAVMLGVFFVLTVTFWRMRILFGTFRFALMIVVAVFLEMLAFSGQAMPSWEVAVTYKGRADVMDFIRTRAPAFGSAKEALPITRIWEFPVAQYWPFHMEGPAVTRIAAAYSTPVYGTPLGTLGLLFTHLFRLRSYEELVTATVKSDRLNQILGVSRPIVELAPASALVETPEGLRLASRGTTETSHDSAFGLARSNVAKPNDYTHAGDILDVEYEGDRLFVSLGVNQDAILIYRDNFAPGWTVRIDGQRAELLIVDRVNKAVAIPRGNHEVTFLYRPWLYLGAFALRLVTLLVVGLACISMVARHWRRVARQRTVS